MYGRSAKHVVEAGQGKLGVRGSRGDPEKKDQKKNKSVSQRSSSIGTNHTAPVASKSFASVRSNSFVKKDLTPVSAELHPSWAAKRSQGITEFKGTKVVFD